MKQRFLTLLIVGLFALFVSACGNNGGASGQAGSDHDRRGDDRRESSENPSTGNTPNAVRARMDVAADPKAFLANVSEGLFGSVLSNIGGSSDVISNISGNLNGGVTGRMNTMFSLNVNPREVDRWAQEFPEIRDVLGLIHLLLDSGVNVEAAYNLNGNDFSGEVSLEWLLNNQRILGFDALMVDDTVYLGVPELYDRYIAINLPDLGLGFNLAEFLYMAQDIESFMDDMLGEMLGGMFDELMPIFDLLERHERALDRLLAEVIDAALAEIKNITVTENVSVQVNERPVRYTEMNVSITETELANAARAAMVVLRDSRDFTDMVIDTANTFGFPVEAREVRDVLDEIINEFDPSYFDDTVFFTIQIYLDANNSITGIQFGLGEVLIRGFLDFNHGYELTIHDRSVWDPGRIVIRGELRGRSDNFTGDLWIEYEDRWSSMAGRLGTFDIRFQSLDRYSIRLTTAVSDWFTFAGVSPNDMLPPIFAEYVNNAEITLHMEAAPNSSRFMLELAEPVNRLSARLEMNFEENVRVNVTAPANTMGFDQIDVLLGRDLFTILGNVSDLIARIEGMGYDVGMLDVLIGELLW
ncbi:MAG: hypothetical protein FWE06_02985 [Oscillospiraceae bacterium]|nr:hypothetical protein [Oscillospiraceae bacterium]